MSLHRGPSRGRGVPGWLPSRPNGAEVEFRVDPTAITTLSEHPPSNTTTQCMPTPTVGTVHGSTALRRPRGSTRSSSTAFHRPNCPRHSTSNMLPSSSPIAVARSQHQLHHSTIIREVHYRHRRRLHGSTSRSNKAQAHTTLLRTSTPIRSTGTTTPSRTNTTTQHSSHNSAPRPAMAFPPTHSLLQWPQPSMDRSCRPHSTTMSTRAVILIRAVAGPGRLGRRSTGPTTTGTTTSDRWMVGVVEGMEPRAMLFFSLYLTYLIH